MPKTDIVVDLTESDGNAFMIMGKVARALKKGGYPELVDAFYKEAQSGDYDHLLRTAMEYVEVE